MAVEQKFIGDSNQLVKEYEKILAANAKLTQAMQESANKSSVNNKKSISELKSMADELKKVDGSTGMVNISMGGLVGTVASLAGTYLSLTSAVNALVGAEKQRMDNQKKAADFQMTLAKSQTAVVNVMPWQGSEQRQREVTESFLADVQGINKDAKFGDVNALNMAAASVISATGGDLNLTKQILKSSAPLFRGNAAELADFGGVVGDLTKSSGLDVDKAVNLAMSIQGESRFTSLGGMKNVAPVLSKAVISSQGSNKEMVAREAAAIFAASGSLLGDPDGALTKTAVESLIRTLESEVGGNMTPMQRVEAVRGSKKLQDKIVPKLEASSRVLFRDLLTSKDSQISQMVDASFGKIVGEGDAATVKGNMLTDLTPALKLQARTGARRSAREKFLSGEITSDQFAKDSYQETLAAYGRSGWDWAGMAIDTAVAIGNTFRGHNVEDTISDLTRLRSEAETRFRNDPERRANFLGEVDSNLEILKEMLAEMKQVKNNTGKAAQVPAAAQRNTHQERD